MQHASTLPAQVEQSRSGSQDRFIKRVFLSPAIVIILLLSIFPTLWSLGISFTDIQRGGSTTANTGVTGFLGLDFSVTFQNYAQLLSDTRLHTAAINTMFYVVVGVLIQYLIGFGLALVLNQQFVGRRIARVIFLMPMMMTPVAAAYTGRMMFDSRLSPIADLLAHIPKWLGLNATWIAPWLTDSNWARFTVVLIDSWQWIPFMTLILLAGMQAIPEDIYEAARVDGASSLQLLRRVTFPILLPVSTTVILIRALEIFKIIDIIVVTTGGGPGSATESLTMYIFKKVLTFGNYGYAAAMSYILLILVIAFVTIFLLLTRRFTAQALYNR